MRAPWVSFQCWRVSQTAELEGMFCSATDQTRRYLGEMPLFRVTFLPHLYDARACHRARNLQCLVSSPWTHLQLLAGAVWTAMIHLLPFASSRYFRFHFHLDSTKKLSFS